MGEANKRKTPSKSKGKQKKENMRDMEGGRREEG